MIELTTGPFLFGMNNSSINRFHTFVSKHISVRMEILLNSNDIFSYLKEEQKNNCDVSFRCKDGEVKIQSVILFAASNFWKYILRDNPDISDYKIVVPDTEKHIIQSIFTLLYQGYAQNEKDFEAEANMILPDLVFEITKECPIELLEPFLDTKMEPLRDETTCSFCFKYFARKESCLKHIERMHTKKENFVICEICTGHFKTEYSHETQTLC